MHVLSQENIMSRGSAKSFGNTTSCANAPHKNISTEEFSKLHAKYSMAILAYTHVKIKLKLSSNVCVHTQLYICNS